MALSIELEGHWTAAGGSRPATAQEWLEGLEAWVRTRCASTVCATALGHGALRMLLHPAGDAFVVAAREDGGLSASGPTSLVGPGYHEHLADVLRDVDRDFRVGWRSVRDDTGFWETRDRAALEDAMHAWLEGVARDVLAARSAGAGDFLVALPPGEAYEHEGVVATPLGPRDAAWLEAVAGGGAEGRLRARDFFAWWDGAVDARQLLGRALVLLWVDVRWRAPLTEDEAGVVQEAARLLERAFREDPSLPFPWRDWHELLALMGRDDELVREVARRAAAQDETLPRVGYRRRPVRVTLPGGWTASVPGSCVLEYQDDGRTFVAWEAGRTIWVSSLRMTGKDGRPARADDLLADPRADVSGDPLQFEGSRVLGKAGLRRERTEDGDLFVLEGRSAVDGGIAFTTVAFAREADRQWAIEAWQGLDHPAAEEVARG